MYTEQQLLDKVKKEFEEVPILHIVCESENNENIFKNIDIEKLKKLGKEQGIFVKRFNETKTKKKTYTKEYERNKIIGFSIYDF